MSQNVAQKIIRNAQLGITIGAGLFGSNAALAQETLPSPTDGASVTRALQNPYQMQYRPMNLDLVSNLGRKWQPNYNLYVKGTPRIGNEEPFSSGQLNDLARWLATEHPNWTVVLAENADDEFFNHPDEGRIDGDEAMTFSIGIGAMNQKSFQNVIDRASGLKSGNVLFISFDPDKSDRSAYYFSSPLYDEFGLKDEERWHGDLENLVIGPLKDGGRANDAVRGFIKAVDSELSQTIRKERRTAFDNISTAKEELSRLEESISSLKTRYPNRSGDVFSPDLTGIQSLIDNASEEYRSWKIGSSIRNSLQSLELVKRASNAALSYPAAEETLQALRKTLNETNELKNAHIYASLLQTTEQKVDAADSSWKVGSSTYIQGIQDAKAAINESKTLIMTHEDNIREFQNLETQLEDRRKNQYAPRFPKRFENIEKFTDTGKTDLENGSPAFQYALKNAKNELRELDSDLSQALKWDQFIDTATKTGTTVVILGAIAAAVIANRRRQPSKEAAEAALKQFDMWLAAKNEQFMKEDSRANDVLRKANFDGETKLKMDAALERLGNLGIMITCAQSFREHANDLMTKNPIKNLFSSSRYDEAQGVLSDLQIAFDPESDLEVAVNGKKPDSYDLWKPLREFKPFELSLDELDRNFSEDAEFLVSNLDEIERCYFEGPSAASRVEASLAAVGENARTIVASKGALEAFDFADLFNELSGSIATELKNATALHASDPVTGYEDILAAQKNAEILQETASEVEATLSSMLQKASEIEESLSTSGVDTEWLKESLMEGTTGIGTRLSKAISNKSPEVKSIDADASLKLFFDAAECASKLNDGRLETLDTKLPELEEGIRSARGRVGELLGLEANLVLRDEHYNPDLFVTKARESLREMLEALSKGGLDTAVKHQQAANGHIGDVNTLLETVSLSLSSHDERIKSLTARWTELSESVKASGRTLQEIESQYDAAVLVLGEGDPENPRQNNTISDNINESRKALTEAQQALLDSETHYRKGEVLAGHAILNLIDEAYKFVEFRCGEITFKYNRLSDLVRENGELLDELDKKFTSLRESVEGDPRIEQGTLDELARVGPQLREARKLHGGEKPNPIAIDALLENLSTRVAAAGRAISTNRDFHSEAAQSLDYARSCYQAALSQLKVAENDKIKDSDEIESARSELESLEEHIELNARKFQETPNQKWAQYDKKFDDAAAKATSLAAILKQEGEQAKSAVELQGSAKSAIQAMLSWDGDYVEISGKPGKSELERGLSALQVGNYDVAIELFQSAASLAKAAVRNAEQEDEDEREEAEAAARRRRSYSSSSSSSYGGGGGFSGGGGGGGISIGSGGSGGGFSVGSGGSGSSW